MMSDGPCHQPNVRFSGSPFASRRSATGHKRPFRRPIRACETVAADVVGKHLELLQGDN